MKLTLADLIRGISWWLEKTGWPQDFHNAVYYELYDLKKNGLSNSWWDKTVDRLWDWRAIRPLSKTVISRRGLEVLPFIRKAYFDLWNKSQDEPSFLDCEWQEAAQLYNILSNIKGSHSPVFPSKLGHFIFPNLFIVMDNKATGTNDYQMFWQSMKEGWNEFNEKPEIS